MQIFRIEIKVGDAVPTITNLTLPEIYECFPELVGWTEIINLSVAKHNFKVLGVQADNLSFMIEIAS